MKIKLFTMPNLVTLANLACGCGALVVALGSGGRLGVAFGLIALGAVCDLVDGALARATHNFSPLGVELDSLADVVTFGVAPSAVLWVMFRNAGSFVEEASGALYDSFGWLTFAVALFAALRLARFNVDKTQGTEFVGLPTPATALAIAALGWSVYYGKVEVSREVILIITALLCWLMVAPVRMFSLKTHSWRWRGNERRWILAVATGALMVEFGIVGITLAVALYVLMNVARHLRTTFWVVGGVLVLSVGTAAAQNPVTPWQNPSQRGAAQRGTGTGTGQRGTGAGSSQLPGSTRPELPEADTPFFGEGSEPAAEDTVKQKRPKRPLESYLFPLDVRDRQNMTWTLDPYANHVEISAIDTLQSNFNIQYPFMKEGVGSAYLGNLGAPSQHLNFFDRVHSHYPSFANPWSAYVTTLETMPFYNVKQPFTQLNYAWAGQKAKQEEDLGVIHAQNISPQTGFNVTYKSLGTRGIYHWQAARDKTFTAGIDHTGKRWTIHAGYIHNQIFNRENGGVTDDDEIILDRNDYELSEAIPMRMSDPTNSVRSNTFFLMQSIGVPLRRVREQDFTIADRPAFFIGHMAEYSRWSRRYEDTYNGTINQVEHTDPYYDNWYYNPERSQDSLFEGRLTNRVFIQLQPWNRNGVIGTIDAGVGVDLRQYYQFSADEYLTGAKGKNVKRTEYYAYAGANGHINRYFDWNAKFRFHPFGAAKGDVEAEAGAAARLFLKGRPMTVYGKFTLSSLSPSYWEENFSSNHFMWSNSFDNENETRIDIGLEIPHIGLEARASQSILGNAFYFDEFARPMQATDPVSVTGIYIREDIRIPIHSSSVNLNHRLQLQWSDNQTVVAVPMAAVYASYFFEFNVVRNVLRLQVGLEGRYNTRYYAPGYNPGMGQFYNQREKQLGDYVWCDLFVNAKWKRMRILLKMEHLNWDMLGSRNYFSVLHYPMNERVFKIGVSWNFYD